MEKEIINIKDVITPPSPFSHVVKAGDFIFLSSQLSADLKIHKVLSGNITEQTRQALENIKFLLESAGTSMDNVLKTTIFMKDVKNDFKAMNDVYREYFKEGKEPARVTVQALSPLDNIDIEIDAIAMISNKENTKNKTCQNYNYKFMEIAINEAKKSELEGGIPIGAVLVKDNIIISQGHNNRVQLNNPLMHAEMSCLEKVLKNEINLKDCTLYTTNMPCYLCSGAIIQFGVSKVVSGESTIFPHAKDLLVQNNIEVVDLDLDECKNMLKRFVSEKKNLWENSPPNNCPEK